MSFHGPFAGRFCRKEWVEQLLPYLGWNASAVVADTDFDTVSEVFCRGSKRWLVVASSCLRFTLRRRVKAI